MLLLWNIPEIGTVTADNNEEVKKIFRIICKEFYVAKEEGKPTLKK